MSNYNTSSGSLWIRKLENYYFRIAMFDFFTRKILQINKAEIKFRELQQHSMNYVILLMYPYVGMLFFFYNLSLNSNVKDNIGNIEYMSIVNISLKYSCQFTHISQNILKCLLYAFFFMQFPDFKCFYKVLGRKIGFGNMSSIAVNNAKKTIILRWMLSIGIPKTHSAPLT